MPELVLMHIDQELRRIALGERELKVGRSDAADIRVLNSKVGRTHARFFLRDGAWFVADCDSLHGTFVSEERVSERRLVDGDEIRVVDHVLVYLETPGAAVPRRAPAPLAADDSGSWDEIQSFLVDPKAGHEGAKRLQALFEISQVLEESQDFAEVLAQIMDKAIAIMGAERGFLMLANRDSGELEVHVARDRQGDIVGVERETVSRSLMQRVMDSGRAVLVMDAQGEELGTKSVLAHSIHSALCAPMASRGVVAGVLYVDHQRRPSAFTQQDLAFFTTFAVQAKAAIDASRAYWELVDSLFRASDDFILIGSPQGRVTQANRAAARILGVEELVGRNLPDLFIAADRARAAALVSETIQSGVVSGRELGLEGAGGRQVPLSVSSFALRDRTGRAIGACLIGRDLTELKGLIDRLEVHNRFIRRTFGRYLSDEIVSSLVDSPEGLKLGGEKRRVTVMMSDLRGFTGIAERIPPEQVVSILNNYLGTMTEVIARHHGTIDEFIGDAILVIFGAPVERPDDALRAGACAVEMQLAMDAVNAWNRERGLPELEMGIGLNTGDVVVGNIGSEQRSKYAVVGRVVNLASRIESNTVGGQILVARSVVDEAGPALELGPPLELHMKGVQGALIAHDLRGVGGAFDVHLAATDAVWREVAPPLALRFAAFEGKAVGADLVPAWLVALSRGGATLTAALSVAPLTNLRLVFSEAGADLEDAYAKVVAVVEDGFRVRFTALPPAVEKLIGRL